MTLDDYGLDRPYGQSERWILLGDITSSTDFSAILASVGREFPGDYLQWATRFGGLIESMLRVVANHVHQLPGATIGNTMGDGFLALGAHGHGSLHVTRDAAQLLMEMQSIKLDGDAAIAKARAQLLVDVRRISNRDIDLPELKLKLTANQGLVITVFARGKEPAAGAPPEERRFVGDTINYGARVGAMAFKSGGDRKLVLTHHFFSVVPPEIQQLLSQYGSTTTIVGYPNRESAESFLVYSVPVDEVGLWREILRIAKESK